jgi:hypothetical protein
VASASMILLALMLDVLPPATQAPPKPPQAHAPHIASAAEARRAERWTLDEIFVALREIETGGIKNEGRRAIGDGGKAIGPL